MQPRNQSGVKKPRISRRTIQFSERRQRSLSRIETLEGRVLFSNILVNGDFSLGTTGFTSQYPNVAKSGGGYLVGHNPSVDFGSPYASYTDHTTGTGLMLEADGSATANQFVWQETVNVVPGAKYLFTGYDASMGEKKGDHVDPSPAQLSVYVNGVSTGDTFTTTAANGQWSPISTNWTNTTSTTAVIQIIDHNTKLVGNDFTLDDLSFSQVLTATTTTIVSNKNPAIAGSSVQFTATVSGATSPTGTVDFFDGATQIGSGAVGAGGVATFATSLLTLGGHSITAAYQGNATLAASTSTAISETIATAGATSTSIVSASIPPLPAKTSSSRPP